MGSGLEEDSSINIINGVLNGDLLHKLNMHLLPLTAPHHMILSIFSFYLYVQLSDCFSCFGYFFNGIPLMVRCTCVKFVDTTGEFCEPYYFRQVGLL